MEGSPGSIIVKKMSDVMAHKNFCIVILLLSMPLLMARCRPPAKPSTANGPHAAGAALPVSVSAEASGKLSGPERPEGKPSLSPPAEAPRKSVPPAPRFRVTPRGEIDLRKVGQLSRNATSLTVHPKCTGFLAAAPFWELARFDAAGKRIWSTKNTVTCPHGNRCHETPRAAFLPNENVVAVMDGDSLRMFSQKGRMMALRGGFLQSVLDFAVSPDGKMVAALYPHGLAMWRAAGGLIRKPEIPGAVRFSFDNSRGKYIQVVVGREIRRYPLDFSGEPVTRTVTEDVVDILRDRVLTTVRSMGPDDAVVLPPDFTPRRIVSAGMHLILGLRGSRMVIVRPVPAAGGDIDVQEWEIRGIPDVSSAVVDVSEGCIAAASGTDVYFALLPPFGG